MSSRAPLDVTEDPDGAPRHIPVRLVLFGFPPRPARVEVRDRTPGTRALRTALTAGVTLVLAPLAFVVPPHAPWGLAVLVAGGIFTWRAWTTRAVVAAFEGSCPRCEGALTLPTGSRLRPGHAIPCPACGMEPLLKLDP